MRLSLRLILTYAAVTSITAALVMLLANRIINIQFNNLVSDTGVRYARRLAPILGRYYVSHNGWTGIETAVAKLQDNMQAADTFSPGGNDLYDSILREDRILLLDDHNKLILDTKPDETLPTLTQTILKNGVPVTIKNQQRVGTLISASSLGALNQTQISFLSQINLWMLVAAVFISLAVSISSVIIARSILSPVRSLAQAAHAVASGDYSQKLPEKNPDELGDMAISFNRMVDQLQEQHELRRRAMADVAHELRTPLSVLRVELEGMEDGLTPATPETLRTLRSDVDHLNHLVEDLRMLSLVEAHEFSLEMTPLDIKDVIRDAAKTMDESARVKGISLILEVPDGPLDISGDSQRLAQVFINLISNACRYTPDGGRVVIGARLEPPWIRVWVKDSGTGVPANDLSHIFERFYRSDQARSRDKGGSGLGLAIAKSLVEAHGGKIWAESIQGQGAEFIFTLPTQTQAR